MSATKRRSAALTALSKADFLAGNLSLKEAKTWRM
jgi:hypothetical protein